MEPANGRRSGPCHIHFVPKEISNVLNAILDHGGTLQREAPSNYPHIWWQSHRHQHFRTENTRVSNLCPLLQVRMIAENLHGRFSVGIESRLETELVDANLFEERFNRPNQVAQRQVIIGNKTFHLMELAQMSSIHGFITKDTVNGKVTRWLEASRLICKLVEHL